MWKTWKSGFCPDGPTKPGMERRALAVESGMKTGWVFHGALGMGPILGAIKTMTGRHGKQEQKLHAKGSSMLFSPQEMGFPAFVSKNHARKSDRFSAGGAGYNSVWG